MTLKVDIQNYKRGRKKKNKERIQFLSKTETESTTTTHCCVCKKTYNKRELGWVYRSLYRIYTCSNECYTKLLSSKVYHDNGSYYMNLHISPIYLRNLKVELETRDRDNAYNGHDELTHLTKEQKEARYDILKESIRHEGFKEEFPIIIMLRRVNNEDQIFEGHHRLNIAIELGLETIPVRFIEWQKEYNAKGNWVEK